VEPLGEYDFRKQPDESQRHYRYKWKLFKILTLCGCYPVGLERKYPCTIEGDQPGRHRKYRVDVSGCLYWNGVVHSERCDRQINVEIDGPFGHTTTRAYNLDKQKTRSIKDCYGQHIETYRFTFGQLAHWTDEEIAEEMRLYYFHFPQK
jgi:hypothetical protein